MPQSSQHEADDDDMPRKSWVREEFTDGEQVCDASYSQRNDEGRSTRAAEVAGADRQRHKQDDAESVQPVRGCEFQSSPKHCRRCVTTSSHSSNQAAVRGAFAGASRSSRANRIKSFATSMS